MKYLFLLLLSFPVFAINSIPISEARRYIDAAPNGVPALFTCSDKPSEPCLDFSHIVSWEVAAIVNNKLVNDPEKLAAFNQKLAQREALGLQIPAIKQSILNKDGKNLTKKELKVLLGLELTEEDQ